jgi:septal ring factor EnvC (AmiA/AmiB activator)
MGKANEPRNPVWSRDGIVCTGESYKQVVKLTFARGASIKDPEKLFNSSLEGNTRLREGEKINEAAFKQLIRAAVAANSAARAQRAAKKKQALRSRYDLRTAFRNRSGAMVLRPDSGVWSRLSRTSPSDSRPRSSSGLHRAGSPKRRVI